MSLALLLAGGCSSSSTSVLVTLTSSGSWQAVDLQAKLLPQAKTSDMVLQTPFARSTETSLLVLVPSAATQLMLTATAIASGSASVTVTDQVAVVAHRRVALTLTLPPPDGGGDLGVGGDLAGTVADLAGADLAGIVADLAGADLSPPPPDMASLALGHDDFTRTNVATGWGTATDGQAWGGDPLTNTDGQWSVVNNRGLLVPKGTGIAATAVLGPSAADVDVRVTCSVASASASFLGAVARWTSSTAWYLAQIDGTALIIKRRDSGGSTPLASMPFTANINTDYKIHFQAVGSTLSASAWLASATEPATFVVTATDATYATGQTGVGGGGTNTMSFGLFDAKRH